MYVFSVTYYWTDARQHGIHLLYIMKKQIATEKAFLWKSLNITWKPAFTHCLYKMKQSHWLLCVAKNCDGSRKITPLSNLIRASLLMEWKLTAKAETEWTAKTTNLKENAGYVRLVFVIRAALWKASTLPLILQGLKTTHGNLRFEFWIIGAFVSVGICVFCGWWFLNQFDIVSETPFSCDTVSREL